MRDEAIKNEKIIDNLNETKESFLSGLKRLCICCGVTDIATINIQRNKQAITHFLMKDKTFITTEDIMNELTRNII